MRLKVLRIAAASMSLCFAMGLCACSSGTKADSAESEAVSSEVASSASFDLDDYKAKAADFRQKTYDLSVIYSNLANYENDYWEAFGSLDEDMPNRAYEWLEENSEYSFSTVNSMAVEVNDAYSEIKAIDYGDDAEAAEIFSWVKSVYDNYFSLEAAVNAPYGSRSYFIKDVSSYITLVENASGRLEALLPDSESSSSANSAA